MNGLAASGDRSWWRTHPTCLVSQDAEYHQNGTDRRETMTTLRIRGHRTQENTSLASTKTDGPFPPKAPKPGIADRQAMSVQGCRETQKRPDVVHIIPTAVEGAGRGRQAEQA